MATYFVKNGGSDTASGLSHADAWATIGKVNAFAGFAGGDICQFAFGSTFDGLLSPQRLDGLTFRSYDPTTGLPSADGDRARLRNFTPGAVFYGNQDCDSLLVENLEMCTNQPVTGSGQVNIFGTASARVCRNVTLRAMLIHQAGGCGVIATNAASTGWQLIDCEIHEVGDCGWLIDALSSGHKVDGCTIYNTGGNEAIEYDRHGVYAKGEIEVSDSEFYNCQNGQAVSVRNPGSQVHGCHIHDTPAAIDCYGRAGEGGKAFIYKNIIEDVPYAFYVGDDTAFDILCFANTIKNSAAAGCAANYRDLRHANVVFKNNIVIGGGHYFWGPDRLDGGRQAVEDFNCFYGASEWLPFRWRGIHYTAAEYQAESGQSAHAILSEPRLAASYPYAPLADSPLVDNGAFYIDEEVAYTP